VTRPQPELSVVVSAWRTRELLRTCLHSLKPVHQAGAEVVVVEDAGGDGSDAMVREEFAWARLMALDTNVGYSRATNLGCAQARGEFLLLLNADTEVRPGAVDALLSFARSHPEHGAVAPRLVGTDGGTQASCMAFPRWSTALFFATPLERLWPESPELRRYFMRDFDHGQERDVPQPPTAALLLPRDLWQELGGFDESFGLFFGDVDLARRLAQRGRPIRFLPGSEIVHHGGASTGQLHDFVARWHADRLTYFRKHHGTLAGIWVKACTTLAWAAHVAAWPVRRLGGKTTEPLRPLCRSFGAFLVS
jgi:N-acetylglucosaminyl-diphospho-decaprenol L-rhamnosyltransferase